MEIELKMEMEKGGCCHSIRINSLFVFYLFRAEQEYKDLLEKKETVERDKQKIQEVTVVFVCLFVSSSLILLTSFPFFFFFRLFNNWI
jgi:hypothetical protein